MSQEIIRAAAILRSDGEIIEGKDHSTCIKISPVGTCIFGSVQGFTTNYNRFVDRVAAANIAFKAGQIKEDPKGDILLSEELWYHGPYDYDKEKGYFIPEK